MPINTINVNELSDSEKIKVLNEINGGKQPCVILFYESWCGHCQQFEPVFDKVVNGVSNVMNTNKNKNKNKKTGNNTSTSDSDYNIYKLSPSEVLPLIENDPNYSKNANNRIPNHIELLSSNGVPALVSKHKMNTFSEFGKPRTEENVTEFIINSINSSNNGGKRQNGGKKSNSKNIRSKTKSITNKKSKKTVSKNKSRTKNKTQRKR